MSRIRFFRGGYDKGGNSLASTPPSVLGVGRIDQSLGLKGCLVDGGFGALFGFCSKGVKAPQVCCHG